MTGWRRWLVSAKCHPYGLEHTVAFVSKSPFENVMDE
jgi:hypothetical protein